MPRLKQNVTPVDQFRGLIIGMATVLVGGVSGLAPKAGMSDKTLYRRMQAPDALTIAELRRIRRALSIDKDEYMEIIGKMM